MVDFRDFEEGELWFNTQAVGVGFGFATRSLLRSMPFGISDGLKAPLPHIETYSLELLGSCSNAWTFACWPAFGRRYLSKTGYKKKKLDDVYRSVAGYFEQENSDAVEHCSATADCIEIAFHAFLEDDLSLSNRASATAVALAADSAEYSAAAHIIEAAAKEDAGLIQSGVMANDLCKYPLWLGSVPNIFDAKWAGVQNELLSLNSDWSVWVDWYEDRILGDNNIRARKIIQELEFNRISLISNYSRSGPRKLNKEISNAENQYRLSVPEQRIATAQFYLGNDGRLYKTETPPPLARNASQEDRLRRALAAHREILSSVEEINPGRNAPAFARALRDYRRALGQSYEELDVIALGIHGTRISAFAERCSNVLLEEADAELAALVVSHRGLVRQFDEWLAWEADARANLPQEALDLAQRFALALASDNAIVSDEAAETLRESARSVELDALLEPLSNSGDRLPKEVQENHLRVVGNAVAAYLGEALKLVRTKSLEGIGKGAGIAATITTVAGFAELVSVIQSEFSWVNYVIKAIQDAAKSIGVLS